MRDIFRQLIRELGYSSETKFAEAIGVSQNRISTFFTSRVKYPRLDIIINTKQKFPQVNLNALFGDGGPLVFSEKQMEEISDHNFSTLSPNMESYLNQLKSQNDHFKEEIDVYRKQIQQLHAIIEKLQS
ncbi:MAG: hypothetical protein HRU41_24575 [Saprospiraceae bacterium]|nr:hypothetical protein [Saprospiraceae bacterium]